MDLESDNKDSKWQCHVRQNLACMQQKQGAGLRTLQLSVDELGFGTAVARDDTSAHCIRFVRRGDGAAKLKLIDSTLHCTQPRPLFCRMPDFVAHVDTHFLSEIQRYRPEIHLKFIPK